MFWHYTNHDAALEILRDGVIKPYAVTVRTQLMGGDVILLDPAVWFTVADVSQTVLVKLLGAGWPVHESGMVYRFGLEPPASIGLPTLLEWADERNYDVNLFRYMISSAQLIGEDERNWRLSSVPVPASQWRAVQWLDCEFPPRWQACSYPPLLPPQGGRPGLEVSIGGKRLGVATLAEASRAWQAHVEATGIGASGMKRNDGKVYRNHRRIARVSYNGRVWDNRGEEITDLEGTS